MGMGSAAAQAPESGTAMVAEVREADVAVSRVVEAPRPGLPPQPVAAPAQGLANSCAAADVVSQPSRPEWSSGAQTTQCGVMENDFGWLWQPLGGGVTQTVYPLSVRYGLTPRMDLRWGMPTRMQQSGGGTQALTGVTDQWLSVTYRYLEQGRRVPAQALSYSFKIPTANPAKGFGSGYADHQLTWIASRDVRRLHFDFNAVGTLAGAPRRVDGAAQYGLALSAPATKTLGLIVETDGGSEPGSADRFGQALLGASWTVRPWLVVDAAYTKAFTAGTPRQQLTMGFTYAHRPGLPGSGRPRMLRALGR